MRGLFNLLFEDAAGEMLAVVAVSLFLLCNFIFTTDYRNWWIYKAIMGSQAKEAGYRTFRKNKKPEMPPDTPPEEDPKE